jgi:hypothetical protein
VSINLPLPFGNRRYLSRQKPVVLMDGDEAVKDLKLIDAIYLAAKTGKSVEV